MKRFTETQKWGKAWFGELTPSQKCLWMYLCDSCDCAGVWEENWRLASFQVGVTLTRDDLAALGDRVEVLRDGKVWLTGFVRYQYGSDTLNPENSAHRGVIRALESAQSGLSSRFLVSPIEGTGKLSDSSSEAPSKALHSPFKGAMDKDKDKKTAKEESEGEQGKPDAAAQPELGILTVLPAPTLDSTPAAESKGERRAALAALAIRVGKIKSLLGTEGVGG